MNEAPNINWFVSKSFSTLAFFSGTPFSRARAFLSQSNMCLWNKGRQHGYKLLVKACQSLKGTKKPSKTIGTTISALAFGKIIR